MHEKQGLKMVKT